MEPLSVLFFLHLFSLLVSFSGGVGVNHQHLLVNGLGFVTANRRRGGGGERKGMQEERERSSIFAATIFFFDSATRRKPRLSLIFFLSVFIGVICKIYPSVILNWQNSLYYFY